MSSSKIIRSAKGLEIDRICWPAPAAASGAPNTQRLNPPRRDEQSRTALAELEARFKTEIEAARAEAFQKGEAEGRHSAAAQLQPVLQRLARSIDETALYRKRFREQAERQVVELALAVARRILHREIHLDPELVLALLKTAMERISLREVTEVRLHPQHVAVVEKFLRQMPAPPGLRVTGDPALELGALRFETTQGEIDAGIETQLNEIQRGFADLASRS